VTHPAETILALYAGGELRLWARWRIALHLRECSRCRGEVDEFRAAREELRSAAGEMPAGVSWSRLAADMKANIRVGLAAGECVVSAQERPRLSLLRLAATAAPAAVLVLIGLWLQRPQPQIPQTAWVDGTLLEATSGGIEIRQGDRMLSLRRPGELDETYQWNCQGTLRARHVDPETLQVTIQNVYAE
jgi:anti-sigma factor ChrR (cupin superfamily)